MNINDIMDQFKIENITLSRIMESETANVWQGLDITDVLKFLRNDLIMHVSKYPDTDIHMKFGDFVEENPSFQKYLDVISKIK